MQYPGNLAIVCPHQSPDLYGSHSLPIDDSATQHAPYLRWSYETLGQGVKQFKQSLIARGAATNTVLFAFCDNQVESVICTLAAYAIGCTHVPIGSESLSNTQEIQDMITAIIASMEPSNIVVLVGNEENLQMVDTINTGYRTTKICCGKPPESWESFESLVGSLSSHPKDILESTKPSRELSVFFTSGTTSIPKACLTETTGWLHGLEPSLSLGSIEPGDMVANAVSSYHAFGYICTFLPFLRGACVLLIGPKFSPERMGSALSIEPCTHAAVVPTMMNALAQLTEDISLETPSLKSVILAGMTVNPSIVQRCQEVLGTSTLENFYGMTEGVFISTGPMADLTTAVLNDIVAIGKPISGAQVRVCDAKNGSTVPVGVEGVLHFSGATLVKGYMNCESDEFYNSENRTWFVTGDQAFMGNDKQLYIVGRHKDIIVRGGKNLSPSRIEDLLSQNPHFFALEPQVVAGEDDIAGEVPIVVTRVPTTDDMEDMMQKSICKNLGVHYTPRAWISLDSLGLDGFPRTSSGKIQMAKLKGLVANYMKAKEPAHTSHLSSTIVAIWSQLLGIQSSRLDTSAPVTQAADSILMLSARAKIKRQTGLGISLTEWLAIPTIAEQIETLERVGTRVHGNTEELTKSQGEIRSGPPRMEDMVHIGDDETAFHITKEIVEKILEKQEFSWEDVKDVFPCTDFIHILGRSRVIDTWNIRTTILSRNASVQVREHPGPLSLLQYLTYYRKCGQLSKKPCSFILSCSRISLRTTSCWTKSLVYM
ncbi:hypothetical protein N7470_003636 [Penicillium chermesinum]|nr:hypothetical protein N7470_003636 [Penicillium chermesinum]